MNSINHTRLSVNEIRSDEFQILLENARKNDLKRLHKRLTEFVSVGCPACGDRNSYFRFEKYKCKFLECNNCSTLFMSPRPTPEIMNEYYTNSENYEIWNKFIFPKSEFNRREKICRPNLERIINECKKLNINEATFLEVGAGFGTFALLAKESKFFSSVEVVERTPYMSKECRAKGLNVIESAFEEVAQEIFKSIDVVACFEVIEHVFDPFDFLKCINNVLKVGGLLLFTCPNGKGFDTEMLGYNSPSIDNEHVNLFNPHSIAMLLERAGFEVLSSETPGRLDCELVRRAVIANKVDFNGVPFWEKIFIKDYEKHSENFQNFLANNELSGSMRIIARKLE